MIECKTAVAWGPNEKLKIETIQVSEPKSNEVRIRLLDASLCHTDCTIIAGINLGVLNPHFPLIPGHEGVGIVESIGDDVTSVKPGDKVNPINLPQCRRCKLCLSQKTNACLLFDENIGQGFLDKQRTTRFQCQGKQVHHCIGVSCLTEYTVCREEFVAKINQAAIPEVACIIGCGFLTGYGAALNSAKVEPGSICGVWGVGGVGLAAVYGCKKAGASRIIAIDTNTDKFKLALKMGATDCLNPSAKEFNEEIDKLTNGDGVDFAIECVGEMSAMRQAIETTNRYWGSTIIVGGSPVEVEFCVSNAIHFMAGRRLNGSWMGGFKTRDAVPRLVDEYLAGGLPLDDFITHVIKLEQINEGFDLLKSGKCLKTVIKFD